MERISETMDKAAPSKEQLPPATENFDQVELDEQEREDALRDARRRKHFKLQTAQYWDKVNTAEQFPLLSAEQLGNLLKQTELPDGKLFQIDEANREAVRLLCYYFTNDPRFEEVDGVKTGYS